MQIAWLDVWRVGVGPEKAGQGMGKGKELIGWDRSICVCKRQWLAIYPTGDIFSPQKNAQDASFRGQGRRSAGRTAPVCEERITPGSSLAGQKAPVHKCDAGDSHLGCRRLKFPHLSGSLLWEDDLSTVARRCRRNKVQAATEDMPSPSNLM